MHASDTIDTSDTSETLGTRIRERAYQIWQDNGCPEGCADLHWSQAEAEVGQDSPSEGTDIVSQVTGRHARGSRRAI